MVQPFDRPGPRPGHRRSRARGMAGGAMMAPTFDSALFRGKVALVTGAGRRHRRRDRRAPSPISAPTSSSRTSTTQQLEQDGATELRGTGQTMTADRRRSLGSRHGRRRVRPGAWRPHDRIDFLVNNAGPVLGRHHRRHHRGADQRADRAELQERAVAVEAIYRACTRARRRRLHHPDLLDGRRHRLRAARRLLRHQVRRHRPDQGAGARPCARRHPRQRRPAACGGDRHVPHRGVATRMRRLWRAGIPMGRFATGRGRRQSGDVPVFARRKLSYRRGLYPVDGGAMAGSFGGDS